MNEFESFSNKKKEIKCEKPREENIIALKIFDECRVQECINRGPVLSDEDCTCVILQPDEDNRFGRLILPGSPIYMPDMACKAKVIKDSFKTKMIEITSITPSEIKPKFWDIEIKFTFTFKIQLYDSNMNLLKILCCDSDCHSLNECKHIKDHINGIVCYIKTITLYGSETNSPLIASDIFAPMLQPAENAPHIIVESKAYYIDVNLKNDDPCNNICDIYDDPTIYIYITIGIFMLIRLFRFVSFLIESNGYSIAKPCDCNNTDPCDLLEKMKFPFNEFLPEE